TLRCRVPKGSWTSTWSPRNARPFRSSPTAESSLRAHASPAYTAPPMALTDAEDRLETSEAPRRRLPTAANILGAAGVLVAASVLLLWVAGSIPDHPVFEVGRVVFGNIPQPLIAVFYVGVAAGLWLSIHLFKLRAHNWQRGK